MGSVHKSFRIAIGEEAFVLHPDECYGFKAGMGIARQLINRFL